MITTEDELEAAKHEIDNLLGSIDTYKQAIENWKKMVRIRDRIIDKQQAVIETVKQAVDDV